MQTGSRALLMASLLCAAILPSACSDDPSGPGTGENGTANLTIRLTDAPGDIRAAVVTISEIYLQGGGDGGRTVVSTDEVTTDLLTLANAASVIVNQAEIPAGTYQELRFVISGGYLEVEGDGGESRFFASSPDYEGLPAGVTPDGELVMPSLAQSGLKVNFAGALVLEGDEDLLIDFDVAQSFGKQAGNSGRWVMQPVIRGAETIAAGSITVTVALADGVTLPDVNGTSVTLANFQAAMDGQLLPFTATGVTGVFEAKFQLLLPGSYQLSVVAPTGLTVGTLPAGSSEVTLTAGANATVGYTVATAELTP